MYWQLYLNCANQVIYKINTHKTIEFEKLEVTFH